MRKVFFYWVHKTFEMEYVFLPLVFKFLRPRIQEVQKYLVTATRRYKNTLDPDPEGTKWR